VAEGGEREEEGRGIACPASEFKRGGKNTELYTLYGRKKEGGERIKIRKGKGELSIIHPRKKTTTLLVRKKKKKEKKGDIEREGDLSISSERERLAPTFKKKKGGKSRGEETTISFPLKKKEKNPSLKIATGKKK